jgi:hypothetical protein
MTVTKISKKPSDPEVDDPQAPGVHDRKVVVLPKNMAGR